MRTLAGCLVRVEAYRTTGAFVLTQEIELRSGQDGQFEAQVAAMPDLHRRVSVSADGCVLRTRMLRPLAPDQVVDLGTVFLHQGSSVRGRVLTLDGRGLPGAKLRWKALDAAPADEMERGFVDSATMHCDADGRFESTRMLRRGTWGVAVPDSGAVSVDPERVQVDGDVQEFEFRVRLGARIQGRLLEPTGRPVAGLQLEACNPQTLARVSALASPSSADGSFVLVPAAGVGDSDQVRIRLTNASEAPYRVDGGDLVEWGSAGLVLFAEPKPVVAVTVRDADTGVAIEEYAVSLWSDRSLVWREAGRHEDGVCRVRAEGTGKTLLSVVDPGGRYVPSAWQELDVAGGSETPHTVMLSKARDWSVRVTSRTDSVVSGAEVAVVLLSDTWTRSQVMAAPPGFEPANIFRYSGAGPVVFSRAATDSLGVARVMAPDGIAGGVVLRVKAAGMASQLLVVESGERAGGTWEVVLGIGGETRGRVLTDRPFDDDVWIALRSDDLGAKAEAIEQERTLARDGTFAFQGVAPGQWSLVLLTRERQLLGVLRTGVFVEEAKRNDLDDLTFSGPWPARLSGVCSVGGVVPQGGVVSVRGAGVASRAKVGADGEWRVQGLLPGHYQVELEWRGERFPVIEPIQLESGGSARLVHTF